MQRSRLIHTTYVHQHLRHLRLSFSTLNPKPKPLSTSFSTPNPPYMTTYLRLRISVSNLRTTRHRTHISTPPPRPPPFYTSYTPDRQRTALHARPQGLGGGRVDGGRRGWGACRYVCIYTPAPRPEYPPSTRPPPHLPPHLHSTLLTGCELT